MASANLTLSTEAAAVATTIEQHALLVSGERVLVAFSGGADSTALAILLLKLGYEVVLGHVDHGMRPDSTSDARHCGRVADSFRVPLGISRVKVEPPTQAQARLVRYQALQHLAADFGATAIATGHTLDDQAETVELRLRRGGLGLGIPARRNNIVRPLLSLRRSQTEKVCRESGLVCLYDPSNQDSRYARVRVRNELAEVGDERVQELATRAENAAARVHLVQETVGRLWREFVHLEQEPKTASISRTVLRTLDRALARQLLRRMAGAFDLEVSSRLVDDVLDKVVPVTGARLALAKDLWVWSERQDLLVGGWNMPPVLPEVPLASPGVTRSREWGLECCVQEVPARVQPRPSWEALFDASAVDGPLSIRAWVPGDKFHPLGGPGTKKLQDFFVDAGVARRHRGTVPILQVGTQIAWVVGHRIDDRFKLTEASPAALEVRIRPMSGRV